MNFSFEGNYKPKRNINLGGVKSHDDKRSLMLKLQNERKAREQERLKLKSATRIQSFYRGRFEAGLLHGEQMKDFEQLLQMNQNVTTLLTLTRELLLFYPTTRNNTLLKKYLDLMTRNNFEWTRFMLAVEDVDTLDTWLWQLSLLVKKVLLPGFFAVKEAQEWLSFLTKRDSYKEHAMHTRIVTFIILNTPCFETICTAVTLSTTTTATSSSSSSLSLTSSLSKKDTLIEDILVHLITLSPPFEFPESAIRRFLPPPPRKFGGLFSGNVSSAVEETNKKEDRFLSRDSMIKKMVSELLIQPFLLENLESVVAVTIARQFPFKVILDTIRQWTLEHPDLTEQKIAGLLMNISVIGTLNSGEYLEGVLPIYAETVQLLLSRLPVLSIESEHIDTTTKQDSDSSDDSSDEEDVEDVKMKEAPPVLSKEIQACLATLYSPDKINHLLHQFAHQATLHANDLDVVGSISRFFNTLMVRWPAKKEQVLNAILYKSKEYRLIPLLYQAWASTNECRLFNGDNINSQLTLAVASFSQSPNSWSILYLLNELYTRFLLTLADVEFLDRGDRNTNQLPLSQVIDLSRQLKNIAFVLFWRANTMDLDQTIGSAAIQLHQLRSSATHLLQHIHMRDSRRSFCPTDHWLIKDLDTDGFSSEVVAEEFSLESNEPEHNQRHHRISRSRLAVVSPRLGLLNNIPFVIPFEQRVEIFRMFVENDKKRNQIDYFRPAEPATIRRHHMFEDGFKAFHHSGEQFKRRVAITFVDDFGLEEAGIDGGGVFKEFLTGLGHEAFDENYGLFVTTSEQLLYPNPNSHATDALQLSYFEFVGLMIGKAVYEGILLDVAFAEFFLKKCLGKVNYLDDLASLDPELYKGLLDIKNFNGNVEDLSLDFTVTRHDGRTIELVPGGSNIPVTNQNRLQYIYSVANYKLNIQISKQCRAFFNGLSTIIDIKWLRMFNQQELQILLGGASVPIDLNDLKANTLYARFTESDKTIQNFWRALESFDNDHRMKFVKFVTSCSRPPLLGFKELVPKFCIGNAGATDDRLPTSSTCVNLLKLPDFSSYEILKSKLLYAITADAGFDLS